MQHRGDRAGLHEQPPTKAANTSGGIVRHGRAAPRAMSICPRRKCQEHTEA